MKLAACLLGIVFSAWGQTDQWKDIYKESAWPDRDKWQKPDELIRKMGIREGSQAADIGCHEGYMSIKLSTAVGTKGRVYAVDVEQSKLDKLQGHVAERRISNIILVKGDYDNPKLSPGTLDAVLILDTYHEMDDHDKILGHVKKALRPGGKLVLCEPVADSRRNSTRDEQERRHELGIQYALEDLERAGFRVLESQGGFIDREKIKGDKMWLIVATPK